MKIKIAVTILLLCVSTISAQRVIDMTGSSDLLNFAASLGGGAEGSPLANPQRRTPMMDILHVLIKDDDGITRTYVGAEVGTAYENETFLPGKVFYNDEELGDVLYRLNAYNNEIEIKSKLLDEEKQLALVQNSEVRMVAEKKEIVHRSFVDKKGTQHEGYLTLLKKGKSYKMYRRLNKKFTEPRAAANSMVNPIPSRFTDYIEYYIQDIDSNTIRELPIHKKRTAKLFPSEMQAAIQDYIKKNKPDPVIATDVLRLFELIDNY